MQRNLPACVSHWKLLKVDRDLDLLYVHGTVPGPKESIVRVTDAYFKRFEQFDPYLNPPPFPTRTTAELQTLPVEQTFMPAKEETDPLAAKLNL